MVVQRLGRMGVWGRARIERYRTRDNRSDARESWAVWYTRIYGSLWCSGVFERLDCAHINTPTPTRTPSTHSHAYPIPNHHPLKHRAPAPRGPVLLLLVDLLEARQLVSSRSSRKVRPASVITRWLS